jgi:hypothetical protein
MDENTTVSAASEAREAVQRSLDWQDDSAAEKADND